MSLPEPTQGWRVAGPATLAAGLLSLALAAHVENGFLAMLHVLMGVMWFRFAWKCRQQRIHIEEEMDRMVKQSIAHVRRNNPWN